MIHLQNSNPDKSISVLEMKDGDVGVITRWNKYDGEKSEYVGRVVQRYGNDLVTLGGDTNSAWLSFKLRLEDTERVILLEDGQTLVFRKNK